MSPEQELQRAGEARQILDAPIFKEARQELLDSLAHSRRTAPIMASDLHTRLILMEQLTGHFFDYLEQIAFTGKLTQIKLNEDQTRRTIVERGLALFKTGGRGAI